MTLTLLRDAVDSKLANLWPRIVTRQTNFFSTHGRFWQGLWSHSIAPRTTTADPIEQEAPPDTLNQTPTNESTGWTEIENFPTQLAFRIRMDAWEAEIHGFTGIIQVRHNANLYQKSKSYPDDRFTEGWHLVTSHGA